MTRTAQRLQIESGDRVAAGYYAAVGARGLRHQDVPMAFGLRLDQVARARAADFLVAGQQKRHRQRDPDARTLQLPDRFERHVVTGLHVEDSRPVANPALVPPRQLAERAHRMHGVEVTHDQDAGVGGISGRKTRADAVTETHPSRDSLDARAGQGEIARRQVHHSSDPLRIPGRAFTFDPRAQSGKHRISIKRQLIDIHDGGPVVTTDGPAPARYKTICVWVTTATRRPLSVSSRVCQTCVRRPR